MKLSKQELEAVIAADPDHEEARKRLGYEKVGGKWWLVDPDGYLFLCVGVNYPERHEEYGDKTPPPADAQRIGKSL